MWHLRIPGHWVKLSELTASYSARMGSPTGLPCCYQRQDEFSVRPSRHIQHFRDKFTIATELDKPARLLFMDKESVALIGSAEGQKRLSFFFRIQDVLTVYIMSYLGDGI